MSNSTADPFELAEEAARALLAAIPDTKPEIALVLGSGWAAAASSLGELVAEVKMTELPGFPEPKVHGHSGTIRALRIAGKDVLVLAGRAHLYEGHSPHTVVHAVRSAVLAGAKTVILTNAAGSLNTAWPPGTPIVLHDQLNLTGTTAMLGDDPPAKFNGRFCDLTDAYSTRLRKLALEVDPSLNEGVYAGLLGGAYETPAEIKMLATLGADLVGMSTVLECIAAKHLGAEILGISLVTNLAAGLAPDGLDHAEVLEAGANAADRIVALLGSIIERI